MTFQRDDIKTKEMRNKEYIESQLNDKAWCVRFFWVILMFALILFYTANL